MSCWVWRTRQLGGMESVDSNAPGTSIFQHAACYLGWFRKRPRGAFDSVIRPTYQHHAASGLDFADQAETRSVRKMVCSVWILRAVATSPAEFRASRKPLLFVRFVGSFVLRFAVRQFAASLSQLPPRFTRFEPLWIIHQPLF